MAAPDNEGGTGQAIGSLLIILGATMWVPALADLADRGAVWTGFALASGFTVFFGVMLLAATRGASFGTTPLRRAYFITVGAWVILSLFGALPFWMSGMGISYTDAVFETVSGLTTTGSTVLVGLDAMPTGILLWRALLQWMGGIGIVVMAIAILPMFRVGGMQMFKLESSEKTSDKISPRVRSMALRIGGVYIALTTACGVTYWLLGMTGFEAMVHAMTTLSTGGYSTSDASMGHFDSLSLEWSSTVFMLAGGTPFVLFVLAFSGRGPLVILRDSQVKRMLATALISALMVTAWLVYANDFDPWTAFTRSMFNLVSVMTTTGYASVDYSLWGPPAVAIFFFMTFVGGCAGSTAGGLKMFRFEILWQDIVKECRRLLYPHGVFLDRMAGRPANEALVRDVQVFVLCYAATCAALVLTLACYGLDFVTALSGAATALANVGPGLGPVIGPAGNFASLPDGAKWALDAGMILGRLEFETVFVMMTAHFWRD
ncbi:Potassium uptake protein TrkH [uncultured Alphaproteobacteria bacterium]|uniref:Trk system potassium uptake protein n=1 Tax=uncultured Alphaproteobacteria bacterium TaxID=91750 RepID=A0A212IX15_9PROT|nr:Potassium uptake protein TrkH [uncultured Alphaproteobacteria bacterium]